MANIILSEEEYNKLKKSSDSWRERYYEICYALHKDEQLDESISSTDIPSDVEMIKDLKKRAADYDKHCKEECEKKYRDEISKLQNIVTEKEVEIKGLKKDILDLILIQGLLKVCRRRTPNSTRQSQTRKSQSRRCLLTIKEMCKEDETNE